MVGQESAALSFHTAHDQIEITMYLHHWGRAASAAKSMPLESRRKVCQAAAFSHLKVRFAFDVGVRARERETTRELEQEDAPAIMEAELKLASGGRLPPFPHLVPDVYPFRIFLYNNFFILFLLRSEPDGICGVARGKG